LKSFVFGRTQLTEGTCYVDWTRTTGESTNHRTTLSVIHAWIRNAGVSFCNKIYSNTKRLPNTNNQSIKQTNTKEYLDEGIRPVYHSIKSYDFQFLVFIVVPMSDSNK